MTCTVVLSVSVMPEAATSSAFSTPVSAVAGVPMVGSSVCVAPAGRFRFQLITCPATVPPAALEMVKPAGRVSLTTVPLAAVLPLLVATTVAVKVSPVVCGLGALTEIASSSIEPITVVSVASAARFDADPSRLTKCVNTSLAGASAAAFTVRVLLPEAPAARLPRLQL